MRSEGLCILVKAGRGMAMAVIAVSNISRLNPCVPTGVPKTSIPESTTVSTLNSGGIVRPPSSSNSYTLSLLPGWTKQYTSYT